MTAAQLMAAGAAAAGVGAAWDGIRVVEHARVSAWVAAVVRPLRRAGEEGRAPTDRERRRLAALGGVSLLAAGWLLAGPVLGVVAAAAGPAAVAAALRARRARWRRRLAGEAAGAARSLAGALAAGRSVRSAIGEAAVGLDGPAGNELRLTAAALAAGASTDAALERLRARAASPPWDTLVAAVLLQRDAGGDLAGLLRDLAHSLDTAERTERDAVAATAQARFTAWLVAALPACAAVLAELASPGFIGGLLTRPLSAALTSVAVALQIVALVVIRRVA